MAELSVQIGANIQELQNKLPKALKLLDKLKLQQKDLTKAFEKGEISSDKYYKRLAANSTRVKKITNTTNRLKNSLSGADKGINKLGKSTSVNATPALQEFSRVVQDAPFGIMGVGNNIQQLTANFGNLSKSAGGSKAALKAMVGSLAGPGGVLLAVSAVTTLLTVYGDEMLALVSSTNSAKESQNALSEAFESDSFKKAIEDVFTLTTTIDNAKNGIISKEEAVKIYNKTLGKSLGTVNSFEEAESKLINNAPAYVKATLLKATANKIAEKAAEKLAENYEDQLEKEDELLKFQGKSLNKREQLNKKATEARIANQVEGVKKEGEALQTEYQKIYATLQGDITKLEDEFDFGGGKDDETKLKGKRKIEPKLVFKSPEEYAAQFQAYGKEVLGVLTENFNVGDLNKPIIDVSGALGEIDSFVADYKNKTGEISSTSKILGNEVSGAFGQLSNNVVGSLGLANDGFEGFVSGLAGTVTKLIAMMLAQSLSQSIAGATASGTATGPGAIFATPAFISTAIGGVLGAFATIPSFAKGGFSGDDNLAFLNKNELVLRPFEQAALFNVLKGTGISGVSNNQTSNSSYGIEGQVVLRGQNQVVQLRRAEKRMKRNFNS